MYSISGNKLLSGGNVKKISFLRIISIILFICIISVSVFSVYFINTHANHIHINNNFSGVCIICAKIATVQNILKQLLSVLLISKSISSVIFVLILYHKNTENKHIFFTLTDIKTRLNN